MVIAHSMLYKMYSVSKMFEPTVNLSLESEPFSADATVQYSTVQYTVCPAFIYKYQAQKPDKYRGSKRGNLGLYAEM